MTADAPASFALRAFTENGIASGADGLRSMTQMRPARLAGKSCGRPYPQLTYGACTVAVGEPMTEYAESVSDCTATSTSGYFPRRYVEVTSTPGATTSNSLPYDEKLATCRFASTAPTAITPSYAAGYSSGPLPVFPAAATRMMFASTAR